MPHSKMVYSLSKYQRQSPNSQKRTLSKLNNRLIKLDNDLYIVLGKVSVDSGYSTEDLKNMWRLADTVLRNNDQFYVCMKCQEADIDDGL